MELQVQDMQGEEKTDFKTSDIVTSEAGRKKLIMLGCDVVGLFPAMKEVNTGRGVANQVRKSPMRRLPGTVLATEYSVETSQR